jgi:hypothetical protein
METPAGQTVAALADAHLKEAATHIMMPRQQFSLSIMYLGPMDKWDRICSDKNSKSKFIQTFGKILSVKCDELLQWVLVIKHQFPNDNITINASCANQNAIDKIIDDLFNTASTHDQNSIANQIDEQAHLNAPGADLHENRPEDDLAVEHAFVRIEPNDNSHDCEEQQRQFILNQFQSKLFPDESVAATENEPTISQVIIRIQNSILYRNSYHDFILGCCPKDTPNKVRQRSRPQKRLHRISQNYELHIPNSLCVWLSFRWSTYRRTASAYVASRVQYLQ